MAAVFVRVGYQLLAGPDSEHDNLGTALMWVVWWPLFLVVTILGVVLLQNVAMLDVWTSVLDYRQDGTANFTRFGYALIPLDIAGHLAHDLFHLLGEGKAAWLTALPLLGREPAPGASAAVAGTGTIRLLQYAVVALESPGRSTRRGESHEAATTACGAGASRSFRTPR